MYRQWNHHSGMFSRHLWAYRFVSMAIPQFMVLQNSKYSRLAIDGKCVCLTPDSAHVLLHVAVVPTCSSSSELTLCSSQGKMFTFTSLSLLYVLSYLQHLLVTHMPLLARASHKLDSMTAVKQSAASCHALEQLEDLANQLLLCLQWCKQIYA